MTLATSGRGHQDQLNADVFSWSELPDLLAAEDLFEVVNVVGIDRLAVLAAKEDADADADEEDEDEDEDDELDDDEEEDEEEEDEEWEEVEDEDDEEDDEE
ncbi:MAG: hypothetical protein WCQ77_01270, partial [Planctomycetota bacterium]